MHCLSLSAMSSSDTMNKKSRLGLLFKEYYEEMVTAVTSNQRSDYYSLNKLKLLKTEPLMSKAVESLRSYKEAELELRMLLYNNCDKLLEAVQVVVDIRSGSNELVNRSNDLRIEEMKLKDILKNRNFSDAMKLESIIVNQEYLEQIENIVDLPNMLRKGIRDLEYFLKIWSEFL